MVMSTAAERKHVAAALRPARSTAASRRDRVIVLIALFKFGKVAVLSAVGFGALQMLRPEVAAGAEAWAAELALNDERQLLQYSLEQVGAMSAERLRAYGVGAFCYAALFAVEGFGLWFEKRWAEYLTVVAGASLIPIELYELSRHVGPVKVAILLINIAIVWYLVVRLKNERAAARTVA